jgi:hypothetical protein
MAPPRETIIPAITRREIAGKHLFIDKPPFYQKFLPLPIKGDRETKHQWTEIIDKA